METKIPNSIKEKIIKFKKSYLFKKYINDILNILILFILSFILFSIAEYYLYLSIKIKTVIILLLIFLILILLHKIFSTIYNLYNIDKVLSDEDAAKLISKYFPEIEDKLLNLIQLSKIEEVNYLIDNAIKEKIIKVEKYNLFEKIRIYDYTKRLLYLLTYAFFIMSLFFIFNEKIISGSNRLMHYNKQFFPPPPYNLRILEIDSLIDEKSDFVVKIKILGNKIPDIINAYIIEDKNSSEIVIPMEKIDKNIYYLRKKNINNDFYISFGDELYRTNYYKIKVIKAPKIKSIKTIIKYPVYSNLINDTLNSLFRSLSLLKGSNIFYNLVLDKKYKFIEIYSKKSGEMRKIFHNTDKIHLNFNVLKNDSIIITAFYDDNYKYIVHEYSIISIEDQYPFVQIVDPPSEYIVPDYGIIDVRIFAKDDYGFTKINLYYKKSNDDKYKYIPINYGKFDNKEIDINYKWDIYALNDTQTTEIEYFIEVYDNDYITGPKKSRTNINILRIYNEEEKKQLLSKYLENLRDSIENIVNEFNKNISKINNLSNEQFLSNELNYERQIYIKYTLNYLKSLKDQIEAIDKNFDDIIKEMEKYPEYQSLTKTYNELKKLISKLNNTYLQRLINKLEESKYNNRLLNNNDKIKKDIEYIDYTLNKFKKLLNKYLTLQQLEDIISELNKIKNEKYDLKNEYSKNSDFSNHLNKLMSEENNILKKLDSLRKYVENKSHEKLLDSAKKKLSEDIDQLNDVKSNFEKKLSNHKFQKQIDKSINNTKELMDLLNTLKSTLDENEDIVNYENLRNLLENLIELSITQEKILMKTLDLVSQNDSRFMDILRRQISLRDNFEVIKDSLLSLSKKVIQIQDIILEKINNINNTMVNAEKSLKSKNKNLSILYERQNMTYLNELSDLLIDALDQLRSEIKLKLNGTNMCNNPKQNNSGSSMMKIAKKQSQLNKMLEQLWNNMNNGKLSYDEYKRLAKEQENIRNELQQYYEKIKQNGKQGLGDLSKIADMMRQTETELLDMKITESTLKRQYELLNKLLDYDKAMREREYDKQRVSESSKYQRFFSSYANIKEQNGNMIRKYEYKYQEMRYRNIYKLLLNHYYNLIYNNETK